MPAVFQGIARKVVLVPIALTVIGWFLVLVGFSYGTKKEGFPASGSDMFPYWCTIIGGPVAIICAVAQAALPRPVGTIVGGITTFFACLFTACLGMILYISGSYLHNVPATSDVKFITLPFAGSIIAILFWTATQILANFYDFTGMNQQGGYQYERTVQ